MDRSYYFKHLKVEDGLTQNTVFAILQDSKGFMWFGTKDGLNRYDGYKFKTFRKDPSDPSSLGNNYVQSLYEDKQGDIWVGTSAGLYIYDTAMDIFRRFDVTTADGNRVARNVECIKADGQGNIWIGACWQGLFRYDTAKRELSMTAYVDGTPRGLANNGIQDICIDSDGKVWVALIGGGLNMYDHSTGTIRFFNIDLPGMRNEVMSLLEESGNTILLGTTGAGILRFDKITHEMTPFINNEEGTMYVRCILKQDSDNIWIGSESGLYIYRIPDRRLENIRLDYSDRYSLSSNAVYMLYNDREGGMWMGTYFGGVNYLSPDNDYFEKFFPRNVPGGLSGNAVREFQEDARGNLWIGTEDNGLNLFDPRAGSFRNFTPDNSDLTYSNVHGLLVDGDRLFVGYFMKGLDVVDLRTFAVKNYTTRHNDVSLCSNNVFSIMKDSSGNYWVGTIAGLNTFDPETEIFTRVPEVGIHAFISDIIEDRRGLIWVATQSEGLFSYNPRSRRWTNYICDPKDSRSIGHLNLISLAEDSKGNIWVATEGGGVSVYDHVTDDFQTYTTQDGLPNNVVYKVLEDNDGKIWLTTNNGLAMFDPSVGEFTVYTYNKGLVGNQFNYKSGIKTSDGKLYFGSIQGFVGFDPLREFSNHTAPPVVITRFDLFNREVLPSQEGAPLTSSVIYAPKVELNSRQSSFSFEFAALSYDASEMNRYAYRLEGLEEEWNYISHNQRVSYSNVPFGRYVFRVRGANSDGLWNNEGASLPIRIRPPFAASAAGIALEAFVVLLLLFSALMLYRRSSRLRHLRAVEKMRAAEDIVIQKAKMSFFTSITHEIRTPLSLIKAPFEQISKAKIDNEEVVENLEIMGSSINRLMNLTNELLDFSKIESKGFHIRLKVADVGELLNNSLAGFRQMFRDRKIDVAVSLPGTPIVTYADSEMLVKIFTNLISNAAKFADSYVTVSLEDDIPEKGFFSFTITNDGETIRSSNRENVFKAFFQESRDGMPVGTGLGLPLVKQLAELHGGRIYIDPLHPDENRFVVEIPKKEELPDKEPTEEYDELSTDSADGEIKHDVHIIVAEDESTMKNFLYRSLSKSYRVTACANGEEVLEQLTLEPVDLVITDLVMPKMDGLQLCHILKTEINYSHIPVIILTAKTNFESKIEGLNSGADAYMEKPFSIEHLYTLIENLLTRINRLREAFRTNPDIPAGSIASNPVDEAFISRMNDIILEHIEDEEFSIDNMAEIMNISRSNLYRKIRGVSQMAPNEFIRLFRLKRAVDLLNEGEYRINEICYLVGFNSPSYFAKCFQKQFGVSPKDYLKCMS